MKKFLPAAFAVCLFLLLVGAKWAVFDRYGSDLPNWDQWDAEGIHLLAPWFEHDHFLSHLFTPHNEHRIVATKLQNLAVTLAAGQWDARAEIVLNAALHSALAVACWLLGRRWLAARWHAPLFVLVALLFGLPIAWQNVLGGFHSQQYWLLALSFAAMVSLPFARPWSAGWWAAALAAGLALLTMGSGFLAAAVVFALVAWRWIRRDLTLREAWPTLAFTAALVAVGLLTRGEVGYHQHMKAKGAHDFFFCTVHNLQWPVSHGEAWWAALALWLPWVVVTWLAVAPRRADALVPSKRSEDGLVAAQPSDADAARPAQTFAALGGWVVLQILATAYARGQHGDFPAPRYMDTLAFGMVANALALGWILTRATSKCSGDGRAVSRRASVARGALAVAWLGVLTCGLWEVTPLATVDGLPDNQRYFAKAESYVRAYLVTNDRTDLLHEDIPYPGTDSFIERLTRPSLRRLMPASVRPPLPLAPAPDGTGPFLENRAPLRTLADHPPRAGFSPATQPLATHPTWGSFGRDGAAATGEWRSEPVTATLGGWLKFETAGQLGEPGLALELHDANTGALLAAVLPTKLPGDAWRAAYVRAPRAPFVVVARDESPTRWLAFSAPVEMSNLSHAAWVLVKNGRLIAVIAAVAALLLALLTLVLRSRKI